MIRPYRWLAQYYDELFSSLRAPIDAARERVLGPILPHVEIACDLACGTGTTALILARKDVRCGSIPADVPACP
jgi:hypothetical protein